MIEQLFFSLFFLLFIAVLFFIAFSKMISKNFLRLEFSDKIKSLRFLFCVFVQYLVEIALDPVVPFVEWLVQIFHLLEEYVLEFETLLSLDFNKFRLLGMWE